MRLRETAERADRDRVVAPEDERQGAVRHRGRDEPRNPLARSDDLRKKARVLRAHLGRLGDGRLDVSPVFARPAEASDPVVEPRIADSGRAHVDATPARAEVERRSDYGHGLVGLHGHGRQG